MDAAVIIIIWKQFSSHKPNKRLRNRKESLEDDARSGRPNSAITGKNVRNAEQLILEDQRIRIAQIAVAVQITEERVLTIIHDRLIMSKVSDRWLLRMLTFDKQRRVETSKQFSNLYAIIAKRKKKLGNEILIMHDNVPVHKSRVVRVVLSELDLSPFRIAQA
ncbi:hypothetical protein ILUMI_12542 [Ignelater luminosus]|uniref:Transposase n=1 Tax=Ignelater luminosus TaxID=2038154 RepID=A0A8K0CTY3_IGNLU|nr:hypothetical protein ILUMI_12542 [Ignelater luminosus]